VPRAEGVQGRRERRQHFQRLESEQRRLVHTPAVPRTDQELAHAFLLIRHQRRHVNARSDHRPRGERKGIQLEGRVKRLLVEELEDARLALLGYAPKGVEAGPGRRRAVRLLFEDGRWRDSIPALLPPRPSWRAA